MDPLMDRYRHAQRLFADRRYAAAARELESVLGHADAADEHGDARLLLARAYYLSAQLGRAEQASRAMLESDPTDVYAALLLARTLQRRGRHAEAATWLRMADALGHDTWSDDPSPVTLSDTLIRERTGPGAAA